MAPKKLTKLELQIMEILWTKGDSSIREVVEAFPGNKKPGYGSIQTTVYRMETKKIVRRVRRVANFDVFAAMISRDAAQRTLVDELMALFGGRSQLLMMHLVKSGKLKVEDIREVQKQLENMSGEEGAE